MTTTTTLPPHVLAIDDDPAMRELIADYLGENDLRVTTVATGAEMEKVLAEHAVDVVVLDLRLAGEDGMQLAKKLRETSEIPIIIVSGRKDEADRVMALELGADDYLTKPFGPRELLARVRAVLRRYQTASEVLPARNEKRRAYRFAEWELNLRTRRLTGRRRQARRADQRRIQPAGGVLRCAAAGAFARAAARSFAPAQRGSLRSLDRRPDPAAAAQDRDGSVAARIHQDRTRRRLHLRHAGLGSLLRLPQAL